jgi:hypothetical protein
LGTKLKILAARVLSKMENRAILNRPNFTHSKPEDFSDLVEERAAIMEYDAADSHPTRAAAESAAYQDGKVVWLNRYKRREHDV